MGGPGGAHLPCGDRGGVGDPHRPGYGRARGSAHCRLPPGDPPPVTSASTPEAIALAEHLTATGAVMYSAYWCPHCHEQKELFGKEASKKLDVVECAADGTNSRKDLCDTKAIQGFPTWEINGVLDSGVKSLGKLAELSGFQPGGGS